MFTVFSASQILALRPKHSTALVKQLASFLSDLSRPCMIFPDLFCSWLCEWAKYSQAARLALASDNFCQCLPLGQRTV